jgi:nicotinamide-nucleotide amidase
MRAEIIAVGSELLTPFRVDTNSLYLTAELNRLGIRVSHKAIVGDSPQEMHLTFAEALERADIIVSCGGLGPTDDDRTRQTVASLLGRKLIRDEATFEKIEQRFRQLGRKMPEINLRQAQVIEGSVVLTNPRGTAPGLWIEAGGRILILLPGVPHEMKAIFEQQLAPRLARLNLPERLYARDLRVSGLFESEVEQRVSPLYAAYPEIDTTILASPTGIQLHPRIWSKDAAEAESMLEEMTQRVALALGENLVSTRGETLEEIVAGLLIDNHATIAVAESCTGGLLAERLTSIPGSSAYFLGGVTCYSNEMKTSLVGVPAEMISAKGAVSPEVALALADGIRRRSGATVGVGITGIAGPGGGTPEKPVGLVYLAMKASGASRQRRLQLPGDRDRIRMFAAQSAMDLVRRYFLFPAAAHA